MEPVNPDNLNDPSAPGAGPAAKALPLPGRSLAAPLGPLRVLMVLFIAVPLLAWLAYGAQRFEHLREDSELRLNRTLRIAQEHALKVLQTREINLDQAVAEQGLPGTHFQAFAKELLASEPGMALTMVRSDGAILARWPPMANQPARLSASSPVMRRIAQGQHAGDGQMTSSLDRQERLLSYAKVGHYPAYLVTSMSAGQVKQDWLAEMGQLAAFALPPMLGLWLASRLVLRRTREALRAAEQLSEEMVSRRQVEGALLQAQKMEALGRLTGGVAHDFNNALMVVSTNLALLEHRYALDPQLRSIGRAVEGATRLTRQLLAFSHRQPLVPEPIALAQWLDSVQELLRPVLGRQVELTVSAPGDVRAIFVDSAELELALINLAVNAKDAMPGGGALRISARNAPAGVLPNLQGPLVAIEVRDTGNGMAPEILGKVFEPFFTTKPVGEGTGLGLSQVYGLCQRAGGAATVQSEVGRGTAVTLYFPAVDAGPGSAAPQHSSALGRLELDLVLVEDNAEVAQASIPALRAMGCQVRHFERATHARDWLAQQGRLPDVLLSDVVMPGELDGLGLARHVQAAYPALKVVLMSGYAQQLDALPSGAS